MINKKERVNIFLFLRGAVGTLLLMCILFMSAGTGIASETASDAIIQNARNETEMLLAIRNAAWLKYTDEWDSYLETRKTNPAASAPVFSSIRLTGGNGLVTGGYLPDSFPVSNYVITPSGNELNVSTILDAASASLVPNFLPLAQVSGGNVTLKVTRPGATAGLSFFLDKYAANEMGNFSTIEWLDGYGFISVDSIEVNNISSQSGGPVNIAGGAAISGDASVTGDMTVSGTVTAARGNFGALGGTRLEGDLDANGHNIHSAGIVSGKTGNFENLGATKLAGNMDANGKNITGAGNVSAQNLTASGKVSGNTGEFSGDISARNVTASETVKGKTGNFDNLGATKLAGNMDANGKNITGAGRIEGKTVEGDTGNFDRLGKTTLDGDMSASNHNISGTGTVSMGTGEFTTVKANTIAAKTAGGTIAVASPMNITGKLTASGDAVFAGGMTVDKNMETKGDIALWAPANGKWNRGIYVKDAAGNTMGGIAASGKGADMESIFIGYGNNPSSMKKGIFIGPDGVTNVSGNFSAAAVNAGSGIIQTTGEVKGGTASFPVVKANVIDSNGAASIVIKRAVALGNNSITTSGAGTFDTVNITSDKTSALRVVGRINAGSASIAGNLSTGTISVSGKITAGEVSATNGSFKTLAVNGKKGTQLDPYDFYVKHAKNASFADTATNANYATNAGKAVNADYATRSTTTALADDSKKLGGYTLNEILEKASSDSDNMKLIDKDGNLKTAQMDNYSERYSFKYGVEGYRYFVKPAAWSKFLNEALYPLGYKSVEIGTQGTEVIIPKGAQEFGVWGLRDGQAKLFGPSKIFEIKANPGATPIKISLGIPGGMRNPAGIRWVQIPKYELYNRTGDDNDTHEYANENNIILVLQTVKITSWWYGSAGYNMYGAGPTYITDFFPLGGPVVIIK